MTTPPSSRLVLLHGNLGSWKDWEPVSQTLRRKGIDCIAVDLWAMIAQGCSSLEHAGRMIAELATPDAPCALMGYSLGGRLALHALQAAPHAWSCIALLSTHPGLNTPEDRQNRLAADLRQAQQCRTQPPRDFLRAWNAQGVLSGSGEGPSPDYPPEHAAQAFDIWSLGRQQDMRPLLSEHAARITWLTGERDAKFTALAQTIPGILPHTVPGAGHRLLQDAPEAVIRTALALAAQE